MSAITGGFSINVSGSPRRLAQRDTEAYWRKILGAGGANLNSTGRLNAIQEFMTVWYDQCGWSSSNLIYFFNDNVGSGTAALPFTSGPNLSLINGPTWGANGIVADGVDDYLQGTISDSRYGTWMSLFWLPAYISGFSQMWIAYANAGRANGAIRQTDNGGSSLTMTTTIPVSSTITTGSPAANTSAWVAGFAVRGSAVFQGCFQAGNLTAGTAPAAITSAVDRLRIFLRDDGVTPAYAGTIARVLAYTPTQITASQKTTIYSALKSTIATGLSLP